jgi:membrane protease YdiL (CAAX protease family)
MESMGPKASWGPTGIALGLLVYAIAAPISEEIMFRGVLLGWMRTYVSPTWAVILSSFVFSLGHLYYGAGALLIFVYALVFGWARLRTGNLRACIALHMLLNSSASLLGLLRY